MYIRSSHMSHVDCNVIISKLPPIIMLECLQLRYFYSTVVTNACLTGGMDTEIADTVRYITLLQTLFSTWVISLLYYTSQGSSRRINHGTHVAF